MQRGPSNKDQVFTHHTGLAGHPATCHSPGLFFRGTQEGGKRVTKAKETRNGHAVVQSVAE
jgi:hypothetical protein